MTNRERAEELAKEIHDLDWETPKIPMIETALNEAEKRGREERPEGPNWLYQKQELEQAEKQGFKRGAASVFKNKLDLSGNFEPVHCEQCKKEFKRGMMRAAEIAIDTWDKFQYSKREEDTIKYTCDKVMRRIKAEAIESEAK